MINNSLKKKWEWQNWTYWLVTVSKSIGSTDNRLNFCRIKIDTCKWNNHIYVQWNLSEPNTCTLKALKQRLQTIIHSPSTHQQLFQESEQNKHWKIMNSLKHFTHTKWTECAKSQGFTVLQTNISTNTTDLCFHHFLVLTWPMFHWTCPKIHQHNAPLYAL